MKSLAEIDAKLEKRTAISSLPFIISAAGSYYLTSNLSAPEGSSGITVDADDVTIDLNGFALLGEGDYVAGAHGIAIAGTHQHLEVSNGTVRGFPDSGISGDVSASRFHDLTVANNLKSGISVTNNCEIRDCVVANNGGAGINAVLGCLITHCTVTENTAPGIGVLDQNIIESCIVAATKNTTETSAIDLRYGNTVRHCISRFNAGSGIGCESGNVIANNLCDLNGGAGILYDGDANQVDSNHCTSNSFGIAADRPGSEKRNIVTRNACRDNSTGAFQLGHFDVFGEIIDLTANGGQIPSSVGPWANFAY